MKYTSAEAAKLLRKLNETHAAVKGREAQNTIFVAAIEENLEEARPAYNYAETQEMLASDLKMCADESSRWDAKMQEIRNQIQDADGVRTAYPIE